MGAHEFECRGCGEKVSDEDSYDYDVSLCTSCGELRERTKKKKLDKKLSKKFKTSPFIDMPVFWAKEDSDGN